MSGRDFFVSAPGRIACATGFLAFAGPGAMALSGPSPNDVPYAAGIIIACILGLAATCMLSVYRFLSVSLAIGFFAPLIAGFYVAGLSLVSGAGTTVGWVLTVIALLPLATGIAAPFRSAGGEKASVREHAHA
jgi:ribose/xylose/arabinose/galactoside ABC-type transport system permease subunit